MNDTTTINQSEPITTQLITISKNRKAVTTSLMVAEFFGKQHFHVIDDIKVLEKKCPSNFGAANYKDKQGKSRPMFEMDRTGFTLLAMGFTGEKALDFKIRYIKAFDAMEEKLMAQQHPVARISADRSAPVDVIPDEAMMGNPNTWAVWSWCLSRAVHDPCRKICGGIPVDLDAGETLFTEAMIAADLNLHRGVVRRCLDFLVKYGKATRRSMNKFSVLTIPDWAERASREHAPVSRPEDTLYGMKQICDYAMKSEPTVLALVRDNGFPARKVRGAWEARKPEIDAWRDAYMRALPEKPVKRLPEPSFDQDLCGRGSDAAAFEAYKKNTMDLIDHYKSMIAMYREEIAGYRSELAVYRGRKGVMC